MPLTIKNLRATVHVKGSSQDAILHRPPQAERPSMEYAMPVAEDLVEADPTPAKTATEGKGAASKRSPISPKNADPGKVADRVFDLMRREIEMHKCRGGLH